MRFSGKTVVVTGKMSGPLASAGRSEMNALIEKAGGKSGSSVNSKTAYLVCAPSASGKPSSKAVKATELGVTVLTPEAFAELVTQDRGRSLDPVAWIGLMLDREQARRGTRRFQSRLRAAKLRQGDACMEDVDYRTPRGLDRALFQSLGNTEWIDRHRSVLITGPCGVGKSWLACALGHTASRADRTVLYHRLPRLFADLELARGDGRFDRLFRKLARADLLILTGATDRLAEWLSAVGAGLPAVGSLTLILVVAMAVTPFLNDVATVLVVAPIAAQFAGRSATAPRPS